MAKMVWGKNKEPILPGVIIAEETLWRKIMRPPRAGGGSGGGSWPSSLTFLADFVAGTYVARPNASSGDMTLVEYPGLDAMLTDLGGSIVRASGAYGFDASGAFTEWPNDAPRISHFYNPASGAFEPAGVLIEPTVYNYLLQTVDMTAPEWVASGATVAALGPQEHAQPVFRLTGGGTVEQSYSGSVVGRNYTISAMVRHDGAPETRLAYLDSGADVGGANIQWNGDGTIAGTTGDIAPYIIEVGFGYYWISLTKKTSASAASVGLGITPDTSGGSGSILVWGCALQNYDFATSWIPTAGRTAQRRNDNFTFPFAGIGSTDAGTLLVEARWIPSSIPYSGKRMAGGVYNSGNWKNDRLSLDNGYSRAGRLLAYSGGTNILNSYPSVSDGDMHRIGISWQSDHYQHCVDGVTVGESLSGAAPTGMDIMGIGGNSYGGYNLGGFVRRIEYHITPLFGADLEAATM